MTHPFDQLEKYCEKHNRQKVIVSRDTEAGATVITLECPECEGVMTELTEETKTLAIIIRHQKQVSFLLRDLARELERRADLHDMSKLQLDELEGFVQINQVLRDYAFGSPEYKESLKANNAVGLHLSRNSHHPEYHAGDVEVMGFIDFVEMVIDWKAASKTYNDTPWQDAIEKQRERFNLTDCQLAVIALMTEWFGEQ